MGDDSGGMGGGGRRSRAFLLRGTTPIWRWGMIMMGGMLWHCVVEEAWWGSEEG